MSVPYIRSSDEERRSLIKRARSGDMTLSNKEMQAAFAIDPNYDPYSVPLDEVDPSHPTLFLHGTHWPHLERLRKEDPNAFCQLILNLARELARKLQYSDEILLHPER